MVVRSCVLLVLTMLSVLSQESALVRVGETWRYFKGTQEPSSPPQAWRETTFDDQTWSEGISGFSNGYGYDYDEPTRFPDFGAGYQAVYLRKNFVVTNLAQLGWLTLRIDYSDGFVASLNGTEVVRRNLDGPPGVPVPFRALATTTHFRGQTEEIDLTPMSPLLQAGTNVLTLQVHAASALDFSFAVLPELLCNFTRGPFVQNTSTNRIQIVWKTPHPSDTEVEYGNTPDLLQSVANRLPVTTHVATLNDLAPDTTYYYRVRSQAGTTVVTSPLATFRTLKTSGPVSFVVLGDSGTGSREQYLVSERIRLASPDLVLHVGDIVYPLLTTNLVDARCFSVYQPHMRTTPYFFTIGNHDLYAGDQAYLESFSLPSNTVTGTEHFYSFDHGDVHFAVLLQPYASQYLFMQGDLYRQYEWLTNDLATTTKPWKFLFMHVPMLTSGAHRFDDFARFGTPDTVDIRNAILPIASQYGVQMIFSGHDHNYERFNPMGGAHAIVTGGGGVALRYLLELDEASAEFRLLHHCLKLTIDGDTLSMQAIDTSGHVFDSMTIQRAAPAPKLHQAAWHSPAIETDPSDDLDGNFNGQRFDLAGDPIRAVSGQFANLGRAYVNIDATNLYVGFEPVMIYPDATLFLLLEVPGMTGVTNMLGVGNGLVDPEGQGVDALDFLENLSFTNFVPSVGVVLGDEFADRPSRSFTRRRSPLMSGQGAFRLGPALGAIEGVRLAQFNRSPQILGVAGEENANFIEVAIPLASLSGLGSGDMIKLGAVVGLGGFDTNVTRQVRELDTGYLGISLQGSGREPVLLEGLSVVLAFDPNGDADQDGLLNKDEPLAGTDPLKADTDGDALLDGWEVAHGFNPLLATGENGGDADPDGDGLSNSREQGVGTDPRDAASAVLLRVEPLGGENLRFSWPTVEGKKYALEYSERLENVFSNFSTNVFPTRATSTNHVYESKLPAASTPGSSQFFFRVRVVE